MSVPLPAAAGPGKFYLPAFHLVVTLPTFDQACVLEQGMLELILYRGCNLRFFEAAGISSAAEHKTDTDFLFDDAVAPAAVVPIALHFMCLAQVLAVDPHRHAARLRELVHLATPPLEDWEARFVNAVAAFVSYELEAAVQIALSSLEADPFDAFSARVLHSAAYFGNDYDAYVTGFACITRACEEAVEQQEGGLWNGAFGPHALHLALPAWYAWLGFGLEESRRDVTRGESYANMAIELTMRNNSRYFPEHETPTERQGALCAADESFGFTCIFAVHTVMHCYEARGDPIGGLKAWRGFDPRLWVDSSRLDLHVWWHAATFMLETGDIAGVLSIFRERLCRVEDPFDVADSTSLIVRVWFLWQYFRTVGASAAVTAPWSRLDSAADSIAYLTASLNELRAKWHRFDLACLRRMPFYCVHRQFLDLVAAWADVSRGAFVPWPPLADAVEKTCAPAVPAVQASQTRAQNRQMLCLAVEDAVAKLAVHPCDATAVVSGLRVLAALLDVVNGQAASSALNQRSLEVAGLMGGSVAQMRLLSFNLLLVAVILRKPGALATMRSLAAQHPLSPYFTAVSRAAEAWLQLPSAVKRHNVNNGARLGNTDNPTSNHNNV